MTFNDEQKQAEYEAFSAYFAEVSKRPYTAASRSLLNQLRTIAVGQYGNGAFQELLRANRREAPAKPETTGKAQGGGNRRGQPPAMPKHAPTGSPRHLRNEARKATQIGRSVVSEVAAAGKTTESLIEGTKRVSKTIRQSGATADELSNVQMGVLDTISRQNKDDIEAEIWGVTENNLMQDAAILSAKELAEKYGRDLMFEHLLNAGHDREVLEEKSDRQLANLLKKEAEKQ